MQRALLDAALTHVPACGFSEQAVRRALDAQHHATLSNGAPAASTSRALATLFPRGAGVALCEHAVRTCQARVQSTLEARYGKEQVLRDVLAHRDAFVLGSYALPTPRDVARTALTTHVRTLSAYTPRHLAQAAGLHLQPHNMPFAAMLAAELVDVTCYYGERVARLAEVLTPARALLQSSALRARFVTDDDDDDGAASLLRALLQGVPLAAAPYDARGAFDVAWLARRAAVAAQYAAVTACLLGDDTPGAQHTHALIDTIA